jgi:hypothetical protein
LGRIPCWSFSLPPPPPPPPSMLDFLWFPFIHFTICNFASFRLWLVHQLIMQRNTIWEWLENARVFYCPTFSPFLKKTHKKWREDTTIVLYYLLSLGKKSFVVKWVVTCIQTRMHTHTHTCTHMHTH